MTQPPTEATIALPLQLPAGHVVAVQVSVDDYMQHYAADFHEWVQGVVIKMSPASLSHDAITYYIRNLLTAYLSLRPLGRVLGAPFVMRLAESRREPDLMLILNTHAQRLRPTFVDGPADIAIEVVSPSNEEVDYGAKLREYEAGAVPEYWIIDPLRRVCLFQRLNAAGRYEPHSAAEDGRYRTPLLPDFYLPLPVLWQPTLPDFYAVADFVREMVQS